MKICIVKLSAMGDIIHAMIALQFIKQKYPTCSIDWVVEDCFSTILQHNPDIDRILPLNLKSIKSKLSNITTQYKVLKEYAKNDYDIIIDAQGLIKSALVCKIIGAKKIVGFDKESIREGVASFFYNLTVGIEYEANAIERNLKVLCEPLNVTYSKATILNKKSFLHFALNDKIEREPYIIFVVGASKENKIYPKEKFLELSNKLKEPIVIVWGNEDEYLRAIWIQQRSKYVEVAPKGNLNDLKLLVSNSKLLIGGDTGPTHIAWGLNVASVTIFGNTPEYRNTYITDINIVVKSNSSVNPLKIDNSDFSICEIDSDEIVTLARELI